jgi:hypothetical protein
MISNSFAVGFFLFRQMGGAAGLNSMIRQLSSQMGMNMKNK